MEPDTLDPQIVNLAKAIRQTETRGASDPVHVRGGSGEYGQYQYTQGTWQKDSKAFLGKDLPLEQSTKEQQNEVAYKKIKSLKDQGYNVGQIASIWNSGSPEWEGKKGVNSHGIKYDVPQYVNSVSSAYQSLKQNQTPSYQNTASTVGNQQTVTPQNPADMQSQQQYNPTFAAQTGEGPLSAAAKTVGNIPSSAVNMAKGVASSLNPVNTLSNVGQIASGFNQYSKEAGGVIPAAVGVAKEIPAQLLNLVPESWRGAFQALGGAVTGNQQSVDQGLQTAQRAVTNDPVGQILPGILGVRGAASVADRAGLVQSSADQAGFVKNGIRTMPKQGPLTSAVDSTISKVSAPVTGALSSVGRGIGSTAASAFSQITGLEPDTIKRALSGSLDLKTSREQQLGDLENAIDQKATELRSTGKAYETFRAQEAPINVPAQGFADILKKKGIDVNFDPQTGWNINMTKESTPLSSADVSALKEFLNQYAKEDVHSGNSFLNARDAIDQKLAKFDKIDAAGRTSSLQKIGNAFYKYLNETGRSQVKGLEEADTKYAPDVELLNQIKRDFVNARTGELKDTAASKLANAGNKDPLMRRLNQLIPDIGERLKNLQAVEDITRAKGNKVGTYGRAALGAVGLGSVVGAGAVTPAAILYLIATNPSLVIPMLKAAGFPAIQIARIAKEFNLELTKPEGALPSLMKSRISLPSTTQ